MFLRSLWQHRDAEAFYTQIQKTSPGHRRSAPFLQRHDSSDQVLLTANLQVTFLLRNDLLRASGGGEGRVPCGYRCSKLSHQHKQGSEAGYKLCETQLCCTAFMRENNLRLIPFWLDSLSKSSRDACYSFNQQNGKLNTDSPRLPHASPPPSWISGVCMKSRCSSYSVVTHASAKGLVSLNKWEFPYSAITKWHPLLIGLPLSLRGLGFLTKYVNTFPMHTLLCCSSFPLKDHPCPQTNTLPLHYSSSLRGA